MRLYAYTQLASTNDQARTLAERGEPLPFVVHAQIQTRGRGQHGRNWISPPGSLTATWAVRMGKEEGGRLKDEILKINTNFNPSFSVLSPQSSALGPHPSSLSLLTGLAVRDAVLPHADGRTVQIKWPNDVWLDGKKLAGILCETVSTPTESAILIGIGVNVCCNPALLPPGGTSLLVSPGSTDISPKSNHQQNGTGERPAFQEAIVRLREAISDALCHRLDAWQNGQWSQILMEIQAADALAGKMVRITHPETGEYMEGEASGIAADGALLITFLDGAVLQIHSGSVLLI